MNLEAVIEELELHIGGVANNKFYDSTVTLSCSSALSFDCSLSITLFKVSPFCCICKPPLKVVFQFN